MLPEMPKVWCESPEISAAGAKVETLARKR
jgi:hypothetical protein